MAMTAVGTVILKAKLLPAIVLLVASLSACSTAGTPRAYGVEIQNHSAKTIATVVVAVNSTADATKTVRTSAIASKSSIIVQYTIIGERYITIDVTFADGTSMRSDFGYTDDAIPSTRDVVSIENDQIEFNGRPATVPTVQFTPS